MERKIQPHSTIDHKLGTGGEEYITNEGSEVTLYGGTGTTVHILNPKSVDLYGGTGVMIYVYQDLRFQKKRVNIHGTGCSYHYRSTEEYPQGVATIADYQVNVVEKNSGLGNPPPSHVGGDKITIRGDGNVVGDGNATSVQKSGFLVESYEEREARRSGINVAKLKLRKSALQDDIELGYGTGNVVGDDNMGGGGQTRRKPVAVGPTFRQEGQKVDDQHRVSGKVTEQHISALGVLPVGDYIVNKYGQLISYDSATPEEKRQFDREFGQSSSVFRS